jgi:hypothetical protein
MLSIQKLVVVQSRYYLEREQGRVDAIDSVAGGAEDYYGERGEAPGTWLGSAAQRLGLNGRVTGTELRALFAGLHPRTEEPLRDPRSRATVAVYDLTFSPPKSVSVLFAFGDRPVRDAVRGAHEVAVREALAYMERSAAAVRRGAAGAAVEEVDGFLAAAYRHRASREAIRRCTPTPWSPISGKGLTDGGRRSTLGASTRMRWPAAVSIRPSSGGVLTQSLGIEWTKVVRGIAEVEGVPKTVRDLFSRRKAQIDASLAEHGTSGARASEAAALATRRPKDLSQGIDELVADWHDRARSLGWTAEHVHALVREGSSRGLEAGTEARLVEDLVGPAGLTERRSTFTRRDVVEAICDQLPAGTPITAEAVERLADVALDSREVVPLLEVSGRETFVRRDGRVLNVGLEDRRYTTAELLRHERRLLDAAERERAAGAGVADENAVLVAVASRPDLNDEQRRMVRTLTRSGALLDAVAGPAGAGKTFALAAAQEAWGASGVPVVGVAVAPRAAQELEAGSGIPSTSVAALRDRLARGRPLRPGAVLVVDEAGMVPTRDLAALLDGVERAGGKLVLVGDHRQLPELAAGGAFRSLVARGLAIELRENMRQSAEWEQRAVDHLRAGRAREALTLYEKHAGSMSSRTRRPPSSDS